MTTPDLTTALPTSPRPTGLLPWPEETTRALEAAGLDPRHVAEIADRTLAEDLSWGPDVTSEATLPAEATGTADVAVRQPGCLAGVPVAAAVLHTLAAAQGVTITVQTSAADGDRVAPGDVVLTASGPLRGLMHWRARGRGSATPARRCPACAFCRSTPYAAAAG